MISSKKLMRLAKKWQKLAINKPKRILFPAGTTTSVNHESCSTSSSSSTVPEKGHFVVYTSDKKRFVIPLKYLSNNMIIKELFEMAEEEFGLPSSRAITLPCDANFMEYVISLIQKCPTKDVEKAVILSIDRNRCLPCSNIHQEHTHQSLICSF